MKKVQGTGIAIGAGTGYSNADEVALVVVVQQRCKAVTQTAAVNTHTWYNGGYDLSVH